MGDDVACADTVASSWAARVGTLREGFCEESGVYVGPE